MRLAVEDLHEPAQATIRIGLAGRLPASEPAEEAFRRADQAHHRAKGAGGDQVWVADSDDDPDTGYPLVTG